MARQNEDYGIRFVFEKILRQKRGKGSCGRQGMFFSFSSQCVPWAHMMALGNYLTLPL
jgi:hypothetical protein